MRPDGPEILPRGGFSTKFGVKTGKMNTATRRNRFYAKTAFRTDEREPILVKIVFVLLHVRFTARRRQLIAFPGMVPEITSSYGGIWGL